jgi:hypothetical protein
MPPRRGLFFIAEAKGVCADITGHQSVRIVCRLKKVLRNLKGFRLFAVITICAENMAFTFMKLHGNILENNNKIERACIETVSSIPRTAQGNVRFIFRSDRNEHGCADLAHADADFVEQA